MRSSSSKNTEVKEHTPRSCKVATPELLARTMVESLGDNSKDLWLDPCVGQGAFLQALDKLGVPPERIVAVDLEEVKDPRDTVAQTFRGIDSLDWFTRTHYRFSKIVANPPYLAINKLPSFLQDSALRVRDQDGNCVPLGANYWYAFLCASLPLLQPSGSLCFVLPAA